MKIAQADAAQAAVVRARLLANHHYFRFSKDGTTFGFRFSVPAASEAMRSEGFLVGVLGISLQVWVFWGAFSNLIQRMHVCM